MMEAIEPLETTDNILMSRETMAMLRMDQYAMLGALLQSGMSNIYSSIATAGLLRSYITLVIHDPVLREDRWIERSLGMSLTNIVSVPKSGMTLSATIKETLRMIDLVNSMDAAYLQSLYPSRSKRALLEQARKTMERIRDSGILSPEQMIILEKEFETLAKSLNRLDTRSDQTTNPDVAKFMAKLKIGIIPTEG